MLRVRLRLKLRVRVRMQLFAMAPLKLHVPPNVNFYAAKTPLNTAG